MSTSATRACAWPLPPPATPARRSIWRASISRPSRFRAGPWDLVLCFHYLQRSLFPPIAAALAPGGLLVFCHQTRTNLERHPRPGPEYLLDEGEAPRLAAGLDIVSHSEGWHEEGRHEAHLVARRPP